MDKMWDEVLFETTLGNPPKAVEDCTIGELETLAKAAESLLKNAGMEAAAYTPDDTASMVKAVEAAIKARLVPHVEPDSPLASHDREAPARSSVSAVASRMSTQSKAESSSESVVPETTERSLV